MPIDDNIQHIAAARKQLQEASEKLYQDKLFLQKTKNPDKLSSVQGDLRASNEIYSQAKSNLQDALRALYLENEYKEVARGMQANVPVLLLPLRIETRFVSNANNETELWVRIYPDDFHIHSHEPLLTDNEVLSGRAYWLTLLNANRENEARREVRKQEAWKKLSAQSGLQRALWVAKQTMPLNWSPEINAPDDQLQFPEISQTKTHAWTMAPRTHILPDKFVVHIFRNDVVVHTHVGEVLSDVVFLGPDPFQSEEAFKKTGNKIEVNESFAWITDFNKAIEQGLGMKVKLTQDHFNNGKIDRVMIMGLFSSSTATESKELLEQVVENHLYSNKGFSFLPQGTATNNTNATGSGYRKNENYFPKGYYEGSALNNLAETVPSDAIQLAKALGIDSVVLNEVNNASINEFGEASDLNKAVY
ncbi:MAG: hypothetical protein ICV66_06570, partial [Chitinophagaceae bacterium]|nr:hypothetical protein [Chitinophagaceae bacterium]